MGDGGVGYRGTIRRRCGGRGSGLALRRLRGARRVRRLWHGGRNALELIVVIHCDGRRCETDKHEHQTRA